MAETKTAKKRTAKPAATKFSAEERAAMRERAQELKAAKNAEEAERDVLAKIAEMPKADRVIAKRIHEIVKAAAPDLAAKTWYGMPAYTRDGKVVVFFKSAAKFKSRYATLGFGDEAKLDDGVMWATDFALQDITDAEEKKIAALVKKAVS
jgi:uncharacterized protein YdhG (YjbR/CyaY superfamily)